MISTYCKFLLSNQLSALLSLFVIAGSTQVNALDAGNIKLTSSQGYPLRATIQLSNTHNLSKEEIRISQAPIEVYEQLGVDRNALYKTVLFDISDDKLVNVYSKDPIDEPSLHLVIQFRWPEGSLYREVKLQLSPPRITSR